MKRLCIDPGTTTSGVVVYHPDTKTLGAIHAEMENERIPGYIGAVRPDEVAIELFQPGGMFGHSCLQTVLWTGRILQVIDDLGIPCHTVKRNDVKRAMHGKCKGNDASIHRRLLELFGACHGLDATDKALKGSKASPGPLYGMKSHAWAALAVGVTVDGGKV